MNDFYKIELTQHASKDLDRLKEQRAKVLKALNALKEKPHLGHMLKGSLKGVRSLKFNINIKQVLSFSNTIYAALYATPFMLNFRLLTPFSDPLSICPR